MQSLHFGPQVCNPGELHDKYAETVHENVSPKLTYVRGRVTSPDL
jgi:hypothetical protein